LWDHRDLKLESEASKNKATSVPTLSIHSTHLERFIEKKKWKKKSRFAENLPFINTLNNLCQFIEFFSFISERELEHWLH